MSLAKAVLSIAEEIEEDVKEEDGGLLSRLMKRHARALRNAVEASEGSQQTVPNNQLKPSDIEAKIRAAAAEEFKGKIPKIDEANETKMAELTGCPYLELNGTMVNIASDMPLGASTFIGNDVYTLKADNKLEWVNRAQQRSAENKLVLG